MLQTLLPQINFFQALGHLDNATLSRQRLEAASIFKVLVNRAGNSTEIVKVAKRSADAWRGYEYGLAVYAMAACKVWSDRRLGHDTITANIALILKTRGISKDYKLPPWIGDLWVHRSHRSQLVTADPKYYGGKWPNTPEQMPFIWPVLDLEEPLGYFLQVSPPDAQKVYDHKLALPDEVDIDKNGRIFIDG